MAHWLLKNPEFKEFPVPIKEFIEGTEYLKLKGKVYPRIQQELEEVFSGTVKDMYVKYEEVIFCAGIGSGKSYFSSVAVAYMIYCVACLKDPADYYHKSPGTHIYFMNMCLDYDTEIFLTDGTKIKIGELHDKKLRPNVLSMTKDKKLIESTVVDSVYNGEKDTYKVTLTNGFSIIATDNHPFYTNMKRFQELKELNVGDSIGTPHFLPIDGRNRMGESEIKQLAYLIGDGCTKKYVSFATSNKIVFDEFTKMVTKYRVVEKSNGKTREVFTRELDNLCKRYDLWGKTSLTKRIPKEIFKLNNKKLKIFLSRLWATDGSIYRHGGGSMVLTYSTSSYGLACDVRELLLRFKVPCRIIKRNTSYGFTKGMNTNDGYQVFCGRQLAVQRFINEIGKFGSEFEQCSPKHRSIPDIGFSQIKSIECVGKKKTYDITVKDSHNFIANGMVVHNSVNQKSAQKVVFGEISERVNHSPWFRNNFFYDKNVTSELRFPKNISVIPGNSSETFFEGYNILGGIIDEADSHTKTEDKDAAEVGYDAIKGRIKSRFGRKGMVIIIGSPKTVDGFIMTRIKESEDRKSIHAVTLPIWEAHPKSEYCGRTFHFKSNLAELDVPVEYEDEFKRNPEKALRDLAAIPAYAAEPFFSFPEKVIDGFDPEMSHPMTFDGKFKLDFKCFDRVPRTVHIDLGLNKNGGDKCGLAMGHIKEMSKIGGEDLPIIKIDLMIRIPAPSGGEIQISDVRQIIYNLIDRGFHIFLVTMDGWQSADSLQQMKRRKIRAELSSIDRTTAPYESLKEAIYDGRLKYYKYDPFIDECVKLELVNGNKVDHQPKGSKDVSDAVAGVVYNLVTNKKSASGLSSWKNKFGTPRLTSEN